MTDEKKTMFPLKEKKTMFTVAFSVGVKEDPEYADKTWKTIEQAIHQIYNKNANTLNFEDLYRNAYNLILRNHGEKMYSGLVTTMTEELKELAKSIGASERDSFLQVLNSKWNDHITALQTIQDILMYMDRTFVPSTHKTPVYELGLKLWRENIICFKLPLIISTLNEYIMSERRGEPIDRTLMKSTIKMLIDLGSSVYLDGFEKPFLETSAEFYRIESQKLIVCCDCGDYLKKAENSLKAELERASSYLDPKTGAKIANVIEKEMIANHMLRLVQTESSDVTNMLRDNRYEDLGRMYKLFRRIDHGLGTIQDVMTSHVREIGKKLVITDPEREKDPVEFVQRLLDERGKYEKIITLAFNNDETLHNALNSSFEFVINLNSFPPEYLSLFVDDKLRKGLTAVALDKVMVLLHYLSRKDLFEKFYEQHLAQRLVSRELVSEDAERSVIIKLKTECGSQFISKLENMLSHITIRELRLQKF